MDDYHEFKHAHEIQINEWQLYQCPNYVSTTRGIMALNGAMAILGISSASGNGSASGSGTTRRGGITKGGGVGASINTRGPLPIFDPIVELFIEL